jgi:ATP-dependent Clp protease ATP-binding subunit ClpC
MADYDRDPNDNHNGFRYLMDAQSRRQYALEFVNGQIKLPIRVFNPDNANDKLKPGETIYAVGDEQEVGTGFIATQAYKITAKDSVDENGNQRLTIDYFPYAIFNTFWEQSTQRVVFDLSPESQQDCPDFPAQFFGPISSRAPNLPPHHANGKASFARAEIAKLGIPSARQDFNNNKPVVKPYVPYKPDPSWKVSDAELEKALAPYSTDFSALARAGELDPVVGRDLEVDEALTVLGRRQQSSLCFTGEAGVGKTAMFHAIAQRLADDEKNMPGSLQGATVMELRISDMTAGTQFRGEFEKKLQPIINGLIERKGKFKGKQLILAIDELPGQLQAGAAQGAGNAGDLLKPMLTKPGIAVISATTDEEYRKYIEADSALGRRFEKTRLEEPDKAATLAVLKSKWAPTKAHNNLTEDLSDEMFNYIYTMCNRYAPQEAHPSKDVKVLYTAASEAERHHRTAITKADVVAGIAKMAGLPKAFLSQGDTERFTKMEEVLSEKVKGQEEAIRFITDNLITARAGLKDPKKPWGCFVLQGPPGTGKTQTAKSIAEQLFGDEKNIITLDGGNLMEKQSTAKLIGSPPGYIGFDNADTFAEQVRQKPYSVILFDEVEKAHPDVLNVFLSILNDGKLIDQRGNEALFNNTIILMTSNAGSAQAMKVLEGKDGSIGFDDVNDEKAEKEKHEKIAKIYAEAIKAKPEGVGGGGSFKPELVSRVKSQGGFVIYNPLSRETIAQLVSGEVGKYEQRLNSPDGVGMHNVSLEISKAVKDELAEAGYTPTMGARELEGAVLQKLVNPFAKWLEGNDKDGTKNKDKIEALVDKEGAAKVVIDSLENFEPKLVKAEPPKPQTQANVANDDIPPGKAPAPKRAGGSGPKPS